MNAFLLGLFTLTYLLMWLLAFALFDSSRRFTTQWLAAGVVPAAAWYVYAVFFSPDMRLF